MGLACAKFHVHAFQRTAYEDQRANKTLCDKAIKNVVLCIRVNEDVH